MEYKNNDYELIYLIKENDEIALNMMFQKYEPLIKKIASHYFYLFKNKLTIDELTQEGRIALYNALKTYNLKHDILFYTYLLSCIKHQLLNLNRFYNRKSRNYETTSLDNYDIIDYNEPLKIIENNEIEVLFNNFKNDLDFVDANIFELRCNSFTYKEIATLLEIKQKAIDNRIQKIKNKLKKYILDINYMV